MYIFFSVLKVLCCCGIFYFFSDMSFFSQHVPGRLKGNLLTRSFGVVPKQEWVTRSPLGVDEDFIYVWMMTATASTVIL